jgi:5-methylcytosine-specific restriction enzyme A
MPSLANYGILKRHVRLALDAFKQGMTMAPANLSRTTYLVDPFDNTLWDLKAAVVLAGQIATPPAELMARDFVTHYFVTDLNNMGYPVLRFGVKRSRKLGLRGFDPETLNDDHVLLEPPTGTEIHNAFSSAALASLAPVEVVRRATMGLRFIRNSQYVINVLTAANGQCAGCKKESFTTPSGKRFLEVHHKKWLSEGGPDHPNNMVALCPNCHRQEHHGVERRFI